MNEKYVNLIEEWCEVLEAKAFAAQYGTYSKSDQTMYFWFKINKKYTKIIQVDNGQESVHAFIDNKTLDIYKAASWNAPVKDKRYNLWDDFNSLLNDCEWTGGYLYKKGVKKVKAYGC